MTNQSESIDSNDLDFDSKCPLCFCELEEQPDGITQGVSNVLITGCCKKRLHSLCWDRSPKIKSWSEDNAFEKIRTKLQPDQIYKAKKCPFCRTLSDVQKVESKSMNSNSNNDMTDIPIVIELTSTTSSTPLSSNQSDVANRLIQMILGQMTESSSITETSGRDSQSNRPRYRIHPYSNRERY